MDFNRYKKWFDEFGFVHDKPINIDGPETSENGPLFTAIYFELTKSNTCILSSLNCGNKVWRPTPASAKDGSAHMSPDNMLGVYALTKLKGVSLKGLPWLTWKSRGKWNISQESIFLFYCKFPYLGWIFFPYFLLAMIVSFRSELDDVSGRQKWFLRASVFLPKPFFWYATKMAKSQFTHSWWSIFCRYYGYNGNHPIILAAESYRNEIN